MLGVESEESARQLERVLRQEILAFLIASKTSSATSRLRLKNPARLTAAKNSSSSPR